MRRKYTIGVMVGNIHTDHPRRLVNTIYDFMQQHDDVEVHYYLGTEADSFLREVSNPETDFDFQYYALYDYAAFQKLDLLIVAYGSIHINQQKGTPEEFLNRFPNIPIILLEENDVDREDTVTLISDNYNGMARCIEHLITVHNLQNIVFLAGPVGNTDSNERLQAYLDTMADFGIEVKDSMVVHGNFSENVDHLVEKLLDENEHVEAIAAANDEMTVSIYRVLKERGLEVGKDVAVTGFDNMEMASFSRPPLTTVWQDTVKMGRVASQMAIQILHGEYVCSKVLDTELILRGSCGCPYDAESETMDSIYYSMTGRDASDVIQSLQKLQHRSWVAPYFIRNLVQKTGSRKDFYGEIGRQLAEYGTKRSALGLLKRPRSVDRDGKWQAPRDLYVVMNQIGNEVESFDDESARRIGAGEFYDISHDDGAAHQYMSFLIFDGKRQYGVLKLEISTDDISFYYIIALQLGVAMRYLEMTEKQEIYRRELKQQNEMLSFTSNHDMLTGILNRQGLMTEMENFVRRNRRAHLVVLMADLDHLKQINDTFGHDGGDAALKEVARILDETISKRGVVGRTGGDEFSGVILTREDNDTEFVKELVHKKCEELNDLNVLPFYVGISLGCVAFNYSDHMNLQQLLKFADEQLYEAKKLRRENVIRETSAED